MEAIFKIRTSEFTLELFEAMKASFNGSEAVQISVKSKPKSRHKMTKEEFFTKISEAKEDKVAYRFKGDELKLLERKLLKKDFSGLEDYKIVEK
jgi:hypothetical protein